MLEMHSIGALHPRVARTFAAPMMALLLAPSVATAFDVDQQIAGNVETIKNLQTELSELGFSGVRASGKWNAATQRALEAFQRAVDPRVTPALSAASVGRVHLEHTAWFEPPTYVKAKLFQHESSFPRLRIAGVIPGCEPSKCKIDWFPMAVSDLTGDGLPDLALAFRANDADWRATNIEAPVAILRNAGNLLFAQPSDKELAAFPRRIHGREGVVADFNGDGHDDLFVASHGRDSPPFPGEPVLLMLSDASGALHDASKQSLPPLVSMNHGATALDVDGDDDLDIFVITNFGSNTMDSYFLINDGTGKFVTSTEDERLSRSLRVFRSGKRTDWSKYTTARTADLNGDGQTDLILASSGDKRTGKYTGFQQTRIVFNDGENRWLRENTVELPVRRWGIHTHTTDVDVADIDRDGDPDLLLTEARGDWRGQFHQLLLNDGGGQFVDATASHLWQQGYPALEKIYFPVNSFLVDLDLDSDLDIVVQLLEPVMRSYDEAGKRVVVALNDGTAHFTPLEPTAITAIPERGFQLVPADIDSDGDVDLVGGSSISDNSGINIDIFENLTRGP